ncbi:MAG TPA: amino acid permease [Candidatus Dormibacteraeota bacterium]|nr:amino acid permease [Candidatus Dormibacteraeota bacterium]
MGLPGLTAFGIAAIVGTGFFVLTGVAAARYAGPAIVLSYLLAAVVSGLAALCYAELASYVPVAGSAYIYAYAVLGEVVAWVVGWALILKYGVSAAAVGVGWSGYVHDLLRSTLGVELPRALTSPPLGSPPGIVDLPAVFVLLLLTGMVPTSSLDNPSPGTGALLAVRLRWAEAVVAAGVVAGLTSVLLVLLFGQSRIVFAVARDGFLPSPVGRVHPRTRIPWTATLSVGRGVALLASLTPIDILAQLTNIGTLAAFFAVSLAVRLNAGRAGSPPVEP